MMRSLISRSMNLTHAFIVENGAALYVPMDTDIRCPMGSKLFEGYWVREFGVKRSTLRCAGSAGYERFLPVQVIDR